MCVSILIRYDSQITCIFKNYYPVHILSNALLLDHNVCFAFNYCNINKIKQLKYSGIT